MSITVAMYSHDSVGLGHARRNRVIAHALAADLPRITGEPVGGLLIAGHPDAAADSLPPGWDWLVLPGFTRTARGYASRRLTMDLSRFTELRSSTIAAALEAISPDLFIVDRHPFGVGGELDQALQMLRGNTACTTVLGMRDVLDSPAVAAAEWESLGGADAVAAAYDQLWIYGDDAVYDPRRTGEIPSALAERSRSTGYLSHGRPEDPGSPAEQPYVLTMVGGGSDGAPIGLAAASAQLPPGHRQIIVAGPQMPQVHVEKVRDAAAASRQETVVLRSAPHIPALVRDASAVVCMAGYNSAAEVMATTTPALLIPRDTRRAEQPRRAAALAGVGAVETLTTSNLTPDALSGWFAAAVHRRTTRDAVDLDGLARLGSFAADLITATRTPSAARTLDERTPLEAAAHA